MEGRPERLADYFLVVGLGHHVARFELFPSDEVDLPVSHQDPITDIAVLFKRHETMPKGYTCIEKTPGGHTANLNSGTLFGGPIHLCYCRGRDKAPITEISVFYTSSKQPHPPPPEHETIAFSVSGRPADLNKGGVPTYITIKRGVLYGHNTAITDICLIMPGKGEEAPPGYKLLQTDLNKGLVTPSVFLCYKTNQVHPPSVPYTPEIISRFPETDYPDFSLPESVPLFCLPFGVSVEHWDRRARFPLPSFSTFALTNEKGQCMYGAVVAFYEQIPESETTQDMRTALGVGPEEVLHMNKCICVLSHWPFFSAYRAFLSSLYRLSVSRNSIPLERYIGNLMVDAPFPTMERPRVQLFIGSEQIVFSLPVQTPLPLSVSTHWSLLAALDPDTLLLLHSLLLTEQKLILTSSRPALLTSVGEALRSILFPFCWQCTYIPMCPLAFSNYMQAPVPFIIGVDSQYFEVFEKPSDVSVVDLDTCTLSLTTEAAQLLEQKPLPSRPLRVLRQDLKALAAEVSDLNPGIGFAVEVAPIESDLSYKTDLEQVDVKIREAFLRFHATIICNYRVCLRPLLSAPSERSRDATRLFDQKRFLQHTPAAEGPFFRHLFDTQLFCVFVEQRSFVHSESTALAFFDECTEKLKINPSVRLLDVKADVSRRSDLPTVVAIPPDATGLIPDRSYTYSVFPSLNPTLLSSRCSSKMNRSPSVCSLLSGSPMVARRTRAEKHRDKLSLEHAQRSDALWSHVFLSHICSLWYVLLPAHLETHWNKVGVLSQALELLENMRKANILPSDEVCYRVLMEQCVKIGRPALAVKVYNEMAKAGIQPNAVTYGFYNKVVMEGHWPSTKRNWKILSIVVSTCFYLLRFLRSRNEEREETLGNPDFRILSRTASVSSRKSLSALDVGLEGEESGEEPLSSLQSRKVSGSSQQHTGRVYKLSTATIPGEGDYVVRGDSSYMADKSPRWSADPEDPIPSHPPAPLTSSPSASASASASASSFSIARGLWSSVRYGTPQGGASVHRLSRVDLPPPAPAPGLHLELTSCSQCPHCHRLLYDEVIMANWSGSDADYKTRCPYCGSHLVASLTIIKKQRLPCSDEEEELSQQRQDTSIAEEEEEEEVEEILGVTSSVSGGGDENTDGEEAQNTSSSSSREEKDKSNWTKSLNRRFHSPQRNGESHENDVGTTDGKIGSAESFLGVANSKSPPTTEPLLRRARHSTSELEGQQAQPTESAGVKQSSSEGVLGMGVKQSSSEGVLGMGVKQKPPLPPGARGERRGLERNDKHKQPQQQQQVRGEGGEEVSVRPPVKITIEEVECAEQQRVEQVDSGTRGYIAQMRARGHKRASSAPVHYQPSLTVPHAPHIPESGGGEGKKERGRERRSKFVTESEAPLVVPYLSPVVLRKEVETLITQDGSDVLGRESLVTSSPSVYWNLVWYFSRLQLPTYLPLLTLWGFTRSNRELRKQSVQMKVDLLWDKRFPDTPDPLYLMWLGKVPRAMQIPSSPQLTRRDSEAQLQSLVARTQCGDLLHVLTSLLEDRQQSAPPETATQRRSLYREILFLKSVTQGGSIDTDQFDQEYRQAVQRLPRTLSPLLSPSDHPPTTRAIHCRRDFGPLRVT